jgi:hypothetical protein
MTDIQNSAFNNRPAGKILSSSPYSYGNTFFERFMLDTEGGMSNRHKSNNTAKIWHIFKMAVESLKRLTDHQEFVEYFIAQNKALAENAYALTGYALTGYGKYFDDTEINPFSAAKFVGLCIKSRMCDGHRCEVQYKVAHIVWDSSSPEQINDAFEQYVNRLKTGYRCRRQFDPDLEAIVLYKMLVERPLLSEYLIELPLQSLWAEAKKFETCVKTLIAETDSYLGEDLCEEEKNRLLADEKRQFYESIWPPLKPIDLAHAFKDLYDGKCW